MAFQPSKSKKNLTKEEGTLNMNSMMDMMTIILLFLLKSFSTEGALVTPSEELRLPVSQQGEKPKKELNVTVSKTMILVNDQVVVPALNEIPKDQMIISPLAAKLAEYAQQEKDLEIEVGKEFTHEVNIQGDENLPFEILFKVMFTCSRTEFYKMRLVTIKKG
ncbi:MAG TPA: biopolymer transporter ExbD [Caldithrix abyssi]|uniref:Biopolymer transporter ExbD n=1 Tax=Caldithrix abyssi TaxID=187145 RepID=A0A7V4WVL2_CALAY|nr:biopolymer transporter ExbD [Caldithrix abyssi]